MRRAKTGGSARAVTVRDVARASTHWSQPFMRLQGLVVARRTDRLVGDARAAHCLAAHMHFEKHVAGTRSSHERDVDPLDVLPPR